MPLTIIIAAIGCFLAFNTDISMTKILIGVVLGRVIAGIIEGVIDKVKVMRAMDEAAEYSRHDRVERQMDKALRDLEQRLDQVVADRLRRGEEARAQMRAQMEAQRNANAQQNAHAHQAYQGAQNGYGYYSQNTTTGKILREQAYARYRANQKKALGDKAVPDSIAVDLIPRQQHDLLIAANGRAILGLGEHKEPIVEVKADEIRTDPPAPESR